MLCQSHQTCVVQASGARQERLMRLIQDAEAVYMLCQSHQPCVMQASGARQAKLMQLLQKAEALGKPISHPYTAIKIEPDPHHSQMDFKSLPHRSWYTIRLYRYIYQNSDIPFLLSRSANASLAHADLLHMHLALTGKLSEHGYCCYFYQLADCNLWILSQVFLCFSHYTASFFRHDYVI